MPIPPVDEGRSHRHVALVLVALTLAGCGSRNVEETPLEAASLEGDIRVGDAFSFESARMLVAHEDAPARPATLATPDGQGQTALRRDHWVLELRVRERAPGEAAGEHTARVAWNGADAGAVDLSEGTRVATARGAILRFDVGSEIHRSNAYTFELLRAS